MKQFNIILLFVCVIFYSCRPSYSTKENTLKNVCSKCILQSTNSYYYAVDTTVNPNIVYRIDYNINYTRINDLVRLW